MTPGISPDQISIVTFPHPALRYEAKAIRKVDAQLRAIVDRMFELMYEHRGVGLAATQIALPLRLFVMNASGEKGKGTERVFLNPVVSKPRSNDEAEEGCLSLPNVHGNVIRAKTVRVNAYDLSGNEIDEDASGFDARVIQHETDHLDGTLFIDRLKEGAEVEIEDEVESLVTDFRSKQRTESIANDDELLKALLEWEAIYG